MDILVGGRQQGKTSYLIKKSATDGSTIIVPTMQMATHIKSLAKKMELTIPDPIDWRTFSRADPDWIKNGRFLLDELGMVLRSFHIEAATLDNECGIEDVPMEHDWAGNEVALACASENEGVEKPEDASYGIACYRSALRAYQSLMRDSDRFDFNVQFAKSILNRLVDGKCLTPIEDTPDIWEEVIVKGKNTGKSFQCKRMGSLFKEVGPDGTVTYTDVNRVQAVNVDKPDMAYTNGFVTRLIDKIFPITMPYLPDSKKFKVVREIFRTDPKSSDFDTVGYLYVITPSGEKVELNGYFKDGENGMVRIEKAEYDERKARKVDKK